MEIPYSPDFFRWLNDRSANYYSQFGEDGIIAAVFERIGIKHKFCVEIGASDGLFFSNSRWLIEQGWSSVQIEAEENAGAILEKRYADNPMVKTVLAKVNLDAYPTLENVLTETETPVEFDLLSLDIDGQEFYMWLGLKTFRPRVVIAEYNPEVDPMFLPERNGTGQTGFRAMQHVALARGYWPIVRTETNLINVRQDLVGPLVER